MGSQLVSKSSSIVPEPQYKKLLETYFQVVFHPDFLNSDNPLLGLTYEEFIRSAPLTNSKKISWKHVIV